MTWLIDKLGQLRHRLFEKLMFNLSLKRVTNSAYRLIYKNDYNEVVKLVDDNRQNKLIAFNLPYLTFYEHICGVANSLAANTEYVPIFVGPARKPKKAFKTATFDFLLSQGISLENNLVENPWLNLFSPKAFIETAISGYSADVKCPKIIYTHGMGGLNFSKDLSYIKYISRYNAIFLNGPLQRRALISAQNNYGVKLPDMYEVGYVRGDILANMRKGFDRIAFLNGLGLDDVPTILFAPTWGKFSATNAWIDYVVKACNELGVNLLLRLHPILLTGKTKYETGGVNWVEKINDITNKNKNVRFVNSLKLEPIMLASEVMVTDVSGMAMEFMVLDRPVVFLPCKMYFELYGEDRPEKWCRPDSEITSYQDLNLALRKSLISKSAILSSDALIYNKGKSIVNFYNALSYVIDNDKSQ